MNHKTISIGLIIVLAISLGIVFTSCKKQATIPRDDTSQSKEENQTTTPVDDTEPTEEVMNTIAEGNNTFAFDLYSQLAKESEDDNIFFSPYSLSVAITMTYEGAKEKTAEEIRSVLHIAEDDAQRRANIASIYNDINKKDNKYTLSTANALWAHKNYPILKDYSDTIERYYGGKITNLDFVNEQEESRKTINAWIEDHTNNKIKDLISQGVLSENTRLILTNAIYFKGTWKKQFEKKNTRDEDFTIRPGQKVKIPMMSLIGDDTNFNYAETEELQILEMPYEGEEISMLILLPKEKSLQILEESISYQRLSDYKNMLREQRVNVYIPKFTFETKFTMARTLKNMGMVSAFTSPELPDGADFSGIDGEKKVFIQNVIHQAFVEVNEEGTEAAAATAIGIGITSIGTEIPTFRADHPFIFIIQQKNTGNILFFGRVNDPSK